MTATRSAMFHARPRSWVTAMIEMPCSSTSDRISARISPRIEASSDATGSSASSSCGPSAIAPAMSTRWRCPPETSCGYRRRYRSGGRRPARASASATSVGSSPAHLVDADPLGDRLVDRVTRVQRARRVLEDHLHPAPERPQRRRTLRDRRTVEHDRAGRHPLEAEDRADQRRLAAPRLADEGEHLAAPDVEVDAVDGVHEPAAGRER